MSRRVIIGIIIGIAVIVVVVIAGASLSIYIRGGSGEPSEEISAPTLEPRAAETEAATPSEEMVETEASVETNDLLFHIIPEESEVRFVLNEVLRGQPTQVTGRTSEVAGDILVDRVNPANSVIGTIRINVRTLQTDQEMRNRAIRAEILESARDEYEFAQFEPTELIGMPESVEVGTPFSFTIVGNLTVRDITSEVTFEVTVNPISEMMIEGSASAQVLRSDFELEIPSAPGVANVTNEVMLEIDFVAELDESATPLEG